MTSNPASCLCGDIRVSYTGEPGAHLLCHCLDCRKVSGSTFSNNLLVPEGNFKLEAGTPKEYTKVADTGNDITNHFCSNCGTTLYRTGATFPGMVIIKAGTIDDPEWPNHNVPKGELYAPERVAWLPGISGAPQMKTMS